MHLENVKNGSLRGFSNFDLEGMVINAKNHLQYEMIAESYLKPKYYFGKNEKIKNNLQYKLILMPILLYTFFLTIKLNNIS